MDSQEEIWKKLEKSIERNKRILEKLNNKIERAKQKRK